MDMMKGDAQCVAMETLGDQTHPELNPSPEDPLCGTVINRIYVFRGNTSMPLYIEPHLFVT